MKKALLILAAIFGFGCIPALMGPTGGYPASPTFQSVTVNGGPVKETVNLGTFSATGNSALSLNNTNGTGQTPLDFQLNGTMVERIRGDYGGNINYVATSGAHDFFTGGDSGVGTLRMQLGNGGNLSVTAPTSGYAFSTTAPAVSIFTGGAALFTAPNTANNSNGVRIIAGTSNLDEQLVLTNAANTTNFWVWAGDGGTYSSGLASQGAGTVNVSALYQGGARVPKIAYGRITQTNATTCTLDGTIPSYGIASVACTVMGTINVTFNIFANAGVLCTVGNSPVVLMSSGNVNAVNAQSFFSYVSSTGAAPAGFYAGVISCFGT